MTVTIDVPGKSYCFQNWTAVPHKGETIWLDEGDFTVYDVCWNIGNTPLVHIYAR